MDILWLSHLVPYPPRSGVAQRSYGLLTELCKRHEVTLLAFNQPALMNSMSRDPNEALEDAVAHLSTICSRVEVFEIPWERTTYTRHALALLSLVRRHPFTINWLESAEFSRALLREQARSHALVHFDTISLAPFRDYFSRVPCVMNHHNIESHLLHRRARTSGSLAARVYDWQEAIRLERYERDVAGQFQLHVTCSDLDRERLLKVAPNAHCAVIPNGVDVDYFTPQSPAIPEPAFVFVGTLGWGPNKEAAETIANELWPAIAREWPQAKLTMVGSSPPRCARELANRDSRFVVTGFVDDVRPYMAEASFFLCPITEGGGTKLKVLNAMAMGKVVLAHPIACEGIDISAGSNVLLAVSKEEHIREIRAMLGEHDRYAQVSRAARDLIESKYAYEVLGREMDRQYQTARATFPKH